MPLTQTENKFLNSLITDCIIYRLTEKEAVKYIETRFKLISLQSYKHRKARVLSEQSTQIWLNHFTRVGFITSHKRQIESIEKIQDDSLRQFLIESIKNQADRDEDKITKLKQDIRENTKLLSELNLGTPIISAIKARIEQSEKQKENNVISV